MVKEVSSMYHKLTDNLRNKNIALVFAISAIIFDRVLAILLWDFESNPIVIDMGKGVWLFITLILIWMVVYVWYISQQTRGHFSIAVLYWLWLIGFAHMLIVFINIVYVLIITIV